MHLLIAAAIASASPTPIEAPAPSANAFPWFALAPAATATGYLAAGELGRASMAAGTSYMVVLAGGAIGLSAGLLGLDERRPETIENVWRLPLYGLGIGLVGATAYAAIDQGRLAGPGAPLLAPALSIGAVALSLWASSAQPFWRRPRPVAPAHIHVSDDDCGCPER